MSLVEQVQNAITYEPNFLTKKQLADAADDLSRAVDAFKETSTPEALQQLNGQWARAMRMMKLQPPGFLA